MGLQDFDIAPDNKGGRPEEKSDETMGREVRGDPYTPEKDSEDYWSDLYSKFASFSDFSLETLSDIAAEAHINTWDAADKLLEYGIIDEDEFDEPEDWPGEFDWGRSTSSSSTSPTFGSGSESDSGLSGLVNNAK